MANRRWKVDPVYPETVIVDQSRLTPERVAITWSEEDAKSIAHLPQILDVIDEVVSQLHGDDASQSYILYLLETLLADINNSA